MTGDAAAQVFFSGSVAGAGVARTSMRPIVTCIAAAPGGSFAGMGDGSSRATFLLMEARVGCGGISLFRPG